MTNESEELVQVQVDANKCIGSGACEMLEEQTFLVDDDTSIASVIGTGLLTPAQAEAVIEKCPTQAISLTQSE